MTPIARYDTRADGYCRWRAWDPAEGRDRYLFGHRLLATLLDDVDDLAELEGHHAHHWHATWFNVLTLETDIPELETLLAENDADTFIEWRDEGEHGDYHLNGTAFTDDAEARGVIGP